MKTFLIALALIAVCSAAEEKKTEKRGVLGLGYGGLGYDGYLGGYHGLPLGYDHGLGLGYPYHGAYPLGHGYPAPAVAKTIAPIGFAAPLHAPLLPKAYPHFGYGSPYFGYDHGYPLLH